MSSSPWIWSAEHQRYYCVQHDQYRQPHYTWAEQDQTAVASPAVASSTTRDNRRDSQQTPAGGAANLYQQAIAGATDETRAPAPSVPLAVREHEANFIAGNPSAGWSEPLDPSFQMRTGAEARNFFRVGRVFAMLYTEPAGEGAIRHNDDAFTTVRFGEAVYSQIRRFVIVSVRQNFVHACAISTYRGQGTLKKGCDPREHAIVFNTGVDPRTCLLTGETEKGLYKDAIEVRPADTGSYLVRESRIRFGHVYSIEFNVKVKDIGRVVSRDLSVLLAHYDEENGRWNQNAYE